MTPQPSLHEPHPWLTQSSHRMVWDVVRMARWLTLLGNPERAYHVIHVAGTNGKGSCSWMLAQLLHHVATAHQLPPIGLTTSPHLTHWGERIWVGGTSLSLEAFHTLAWELATVLAPYVTSPEDTPTPFEFLTLCALKHFALSGCEWVILEVGMGGRLDATNVIPPARWSLITSISYDHMSFLGDTLPAIASEKAGILKPPVEMNGQRFQTQGLVVGRSLGEACLGTPEAEAYHVIAQQATQHGIPMVPQPWRVEAGAFGTSVELSPKKLSCLRSSDTDPYHVFRTWQVHHAFYEPQTYQSTSWLASYHAENIQSVLTLCHALASDKATHHSASTWETLGLWDAWRALWENPDGVQASLMPWRGRCEWHARYHTWVDGCHNVAGWYAFFETLSQFEQDTQAHCETLWVALPENRRVDSFLQALTHHGVTPTRLRIVTPSPEEQALLPAGYHSLEAVKPYVTSYEGALTLGEAVTSFEEAKHHIQAFVPQEPLRYQAVCGSLYWISTLYR
ncbi:MAG: bifunctional folylpolyglutamate synthase/dihydrofolate synthase [Vampirovibrionales bacterium]